MRVGRYTVIFNSATNAIETNRVKERVFKYMSYFDRFTKLKRNDEIEVSVPLISLPFDKYLSGRRTQSDLIHFTH